MILFEIDTEPYNAEFILSYRDRILIKLNNLPINKQVKYLKKQIKTHEKIIKNLKKKNIKLNNKGKIHNIIPIKPLYDELNFLNQKYQQVLNKQLEHLISKTNKVEEGKIING